MRTVLIVAGVTFPPAANPGVHRCLGWVEHLPRRGWRVIVLTLPLSYWPEDLQDGSLLRRVPESARIERVAPRLISHLPPGSAGYAGPVEESGMLRRIGWKSLRALKRALLFPDTRILWIGPAVDRIEEIAGRDMIDVVLSTSPEHSSHMIGRRAARKIGAKWVADFRDPWRSVWTEEPTPLHGWFLERLGADLLGGADAITVVSADLGAHLRSRYGVTDEKMSIVMHGIDDALLEAPSPERRNDRFSIVHTGALYGRRHVGAFLRAIRNLLERRPELKRFLYVSQVGPLDIAAKRTLDGFSHEPWLHVQQPVVHEEALRLQRASDVLLLIPGEDSHTLPGKIFEYLGGRRPILALCASNSDSARLISELGAGVAVDPMDEDGIGAALERFIERAHLPPLDLGDYTRSAMAERMAGVLNEAVGSGSV